MEAYDSIEESSMDTHKNTNLLSHTGEGGSVSWALLTLIVTPVQARDNRSEAGEVRSLAAQDIKPTVFVMCGCEIKST